MKKRRDITLVEMQDECSKRMRICAPDVDGNNECKYFEVCKQMRSGVFVKPCPEVWDLTDPPRFNEAQMAFWRGWYAVGATSARRSDVHNSEQCVHIFDKDDNCLGYLQIEYDALPIKVGETLGLAELLRKDGDSK